MASITIRSCPKPPNGAFASGLPAMDAPWSRRLGNSSKQCLPSPTPEPVNLGEAIRRRFAPLGGVNLKIPASRPHSRIRHQVILDVIMILDTNVVSEPMQPVPSAAVLAWLSRKPENGHSLRYDGYPCGNSVRNRTPPKGKRREKLLAEAEAMFAEDFAGRILPFDEDAARAFPEIAAGRRAAKGRPIADFDAQIAAIARSRGALWPRATLPISKAAACAW